MRFIKPFWAGIADGSITLAFRRWRRSTVVPGRPYRTGGGRVEVTSVDVVDPAAITDADARAAGHTDAAAVRRQLRGEPEWPVFKVEFRRLDEPDPRDVLAATGDLTQDDIAEIARRLDRLDKASKHGAWTRRYLRLVADRPEVRAPDLAVSVGRQTQPFELDIRKLKNLGLTISLNPGYRLSARGSAFLASDHRQ